MELKNGTLTTISELIDGIDGAATLGMMNGAERQSLIEVKGMATQLRRELYAGVIITDGGDAA